MYYHQSTPRRNILKRPPVSNLDTLVIVSSAETPEMIPLAVDKLTVYCEITGIRPILVFTKADLASEERMRELENMYRGGVSRLSHQQRHRRGCGRPSQGRCGTERGSGGSVGRGQIHIAERIDCGCGCGDRKPQREDRPGKAHHAARGNFFHWITPPMCTTRRDLRLWICRRWILGSFGISSRNSGNPELIAATATACTLTSRHAA